jgi:nucleotide-binding universal stress UspA family protein
VRTTPATLSHVANLYATDAEHVQLAGDLRYECRMGIKRILVPVDFSAPSLRAVDYAIDFARPLGAELIVVFVVEPIYSITPGDLYAPSSELSYLMREQRQQVADRVGGADAEAVKRGLDPSQPHTRVALGAARDSRRITRSASP